jgi:virginiamycin A acetyltransferase
MKSTCKAIFGAISLSLVWPCAVLVWLEERLLPGRDECFGCFAQVFALGPGLPGMYLRRAYYRWTLQDCARDVFIGFGTICRIVEWSLNRAFT